MTNQRLAKKDEKQKNAAQQLQDFANDSINFFNKCAKPDKNGKLTDLHDLIRRIHEDLIRLCTRFHCDWAHRLHYKARLYSDQQHHPRCLIPYVIILIRKFNTFKSELI